MKEYKYSYFLVGIYITCLLLTVCLANRLTLVGPFLEPGGIYVFPFIFPICDVMAEVYGYSYPRLLIWVGVICELIFVFIAIAVSHFPYPDYFLKVEAYQMVFDPTLRFVFSSLTGTIIGEFVSIYFLSKWKIALRGRWYVLRAIVSTAIGQLLLTVIVDLLAFYAKMSFSNLIWLMISGYLWKMMYIIILILPSWALVRLLKRAENIDYYDTNTNFNPFKLSFS